MQESARMSSGNELVVFNAGVKNSQQFHIEDRQVQNQDFCIID